MAINSKVAAAKKAVKPKSKKTWADNQNPPQSKSYKSAADALVKAKPVGWRWTEAGSARLGKKSSTKPTTDDIEKYKSKVFTKGGVEHRYLYTEARADKSDNSQKTKLKTGGRTKLVIPPNQNPPQSKSYKEETDKTVAAKPVGWRWTSYGAHKLGKNEEVKPSADDIEQYKNKTFKLRGASVRYLYPERRIDKSDTNRRKMFAAGGHISEDVAKVIVFSADDKGNSWTLQATPLGMTAYELENKLKNSGFDLSGLKLDCEYSIFFAHGKKKDVERLAHFLSEKYAAGGQAAPQSESYQEARDKQVHAKPIGYRFTDARANRLGESPYEKPTAEQIEKYKGKGVYWENRMDKSDRNYTRKFEEGGVDDEIHSVHKLGENEKLRVEYVHVTVTEDSHEEGEGKQVNWYSIPEFKGNTYDGNNILMLLEGELFLSGHLPDYIVMDNTIRYDQLQDADGSEASESEIEKWKNGELQLYNAHYMISFDVISKRDITEEELSAITGIGVYRVGGLTQSAPQSQSYTEEADKMYKAKPVGWRFKTRFARRKGIDPYRKPTLEEIEKWKGNGIYYEIRFDKSDKNLKRKFASGGQAAPQSVSYQEARDKRVHAKPIGYRFTDARARRLGESPYEKPTAEQIEKYKGKGVYWENRMDKSDRNYTRKFKKGGWIGVDADLETSLEEYQFVALKHDKDGHDDEYWVIYKIDDDSYGNGYIREKYLDNLVEGKEWMSEDDVESFLSTVGSDKEEWLELSFYSKLSDLISYFGYENILGTDYYPNDKKWAYSKIGISFAAGGQAAPQSGSYQEARDKRVHAKPIGYRFTDAKANRLGESPYEKPTAEQIEKYKGKGVYWENRMDKSDRNYTRKFEEGGMHDEEYARGGSPKIANRDSRSYTENRYDFKGANLEGKTLENGDYVVLSYGYYPIWFYSNDTNKWYGNANGFSMTTKKQISQSRPTYNAIMLQRAELEDIMHRSALGTLYEQEKIDDNEPNV